MAGAEQAQIERLTQLASRVSLNVEAPCGASLSAIAPEKSFAVTTGDLERVRGLVVHGARRAGVAASRTIRCIPAAAQA